MQMTMACFGNQRSQIRHELNELLILHGVGNRMHRDPECPDAADLAASLPIADG